MSGISFYLEIISLIVFFIKVEPGIYVSKLTGKDEEKCGNVTSPCATLQYSIHNNASVDNTILLDGRNGSEYSIYSTIAIKTRLNLTSYGHTERPTVTQMNANDVFYSSKEAGVHYLFLSNINFRMQRRLVTVNDHLELHVTNCSFIDITIVGEKFESAEPLIYSLSGKYVKMNIVSSSFRVTSIVSTWSGHMYYLYVSLDNCFFSTQGSLPAIRISQNSGSCNISIYNTTFLSDKTMSSALHFDGCCNVRVVNTTFISFAPAIDASSSSLTLENTTFINNMGYNGGAIIALETEVYINKCFFFNNSAKVGGAIHQRSATFTEMVIINTTFTLNSAKKLAGVLYIEHFSPGGNIRLTSVSIVSDTNGVLTHGSLIYSNSVIQFENTSLQLLNGTTGSQLIDLFTYIHVKFFSAVSVSLNLTSTCPKNFELKIIHDNNTIYAIQCRRCDRGTYSLLHGKLLNWTRSLIYSPGVTLKVAPFKCISCPTGGRCENGIVSKENFWGYVNSKNEVQFIPCPSSYCCSQETSCASFSSCNKNRVGNLCGSCVNGYRLSFFSNDCLENKTCNRTSFWVLFMIYGIGYTFLLMYYKSIFSFVLKCGNKVELTSESLYDYHTFEDECESCGQNPDDEELVDNERENHLTVSRSTTYRIEKKKDTQISGLKTIIFFFYQIENLLRVSAPNKEQHGYITALKNVVSRIFTFQFINAKVGIICPSTNLNAVVKELIKFGIIVEIFLWLCVLATIMKTVKFIRKRIFRDVTAGSVGNVMNIKIKCCTIQMTLVGYTGATTFCLKMFNCVEINDAKYLYIQADMRCWQWWQYIILLVSVIWIFPYGVSMYLTLKMLRNWNIDMKRFYICLLFPPAAMYYYTAIHCFPKRYFKKPPFDTRKTEERKRILELFVGPFRVETSKQINWEAIIICRRLVITSLCICIISPISRMLSTLPVLIGSLLHHIYSSPFKCKVLNHLETMSLSCLLFLNIVDLFWAFSYMNDQSSIPGIGQIGKVLVWTEDIIASIPIFIIIFLTICKVSKKLYSVLKKCINHKLD